MSTSSRRLRWTLLSLPLLLIVLVACETASTATPEPTSTPTPTPTATPVPLPEPILADPDENPREFFQALPQEEEECLVQALGQARVDQILDGEQPSQEDSRALEQCVSQESFARVLIGSFVNSVGGLSDATLGCMWDILGEAPTEGGDLSGELVAFLSLTLCLSDEDAARADAGAGPFEFPLADSRCVAEQIDMDRLAATSGDELQGLPPELMAALAECGIEVGPEGEGPQFTPEQFTCLEEVLGAEGLAQFFGQGGEPPIEVITAMLQCGIEIGGPEGDDGGGGVDGGGVDFSPEELGCVMEALGGEAVAEILAGERLPTFGEIAALAGCDLDLEKLLSDS